MHPHSTRHRSDSAGFSWQPLALILLFLHLVLVPRFSAPAPVAAETSFTELQFSLSCSFTDLETKDKGPRTQGRIPGPTRVFEHLDPPPPPLLRQTEFPPLTYQLLAHPLVSSLLYASSL